MRKHKLDFKLSNLNSNISTSTIKNVNVSNKQNIVYVDILGRIYFKFYSTIEITLCYYYGHHKIIGIAKMLEGAYS